MKDWRGIKTPHERLQWARADAGYERPTNAAEAMGVKVSTYLGHENGSRGLARAGKRYAEFFRVSFDWLMTGKGAPKVTRAAQPKFAVELKTPLFVPIVGYVGANSEAHTYAVPAGSLDEIEAPEGSTDQTVAVEIKGDSLGALFDRWIVFYDDVRSPVTPDLYGKLCVVGLADERILVKKIRRRRDGRFDLVANTDEGTIENAVIEWAAKVKNMVPR